MVVQSLTQILDLTLHASQLCMGLTWTEIKTEIWISFSSFIDGSLLPQQKKKVYLRLFFLSEAKNFLNDLDR